MTVLAALGSAAAAVVGVWAVETRLAHLYRTHRTPKD